MFLPLRFLTLISLAFSACIRASNLLEGPIPEDIGTLDNLTEFFSVWSNNLSGSLPPSIFNLTSLKILELSYNHFSGTIPEDICNLNSASFSDSTNIYLWGNEFCPPYPDCLSEEDIGYQDTTNCEQVSIYDETLPITYNLYNAYPNPFNPVTTLHYDLPQDAMVNITIYDMMGRQVKALMNDSQTAGYKTIQWNATNDKNEPVSAGIYLYEIQAGEFRQTKKMVLLK